MYCAIWRTKPFLLLNKSVTVRRPELLVCCNMCNILETLNNFQQMKQNIVTVVQDCTSSNYHANLNIKVTQLVIHKFTLPCTFLTLAQSAPLKNKKTHTILCCKRCQNTWQMTARDKQAWNENHKQWSSPVNCCRYTQCCYMLWTNQIKELYWLHVFQCCILTTLLL